LSCGEDCRSPQSGGSGFTLTRLLISLAIMALLLGLLLPGLGLAREKAKQMQHWHDFQAMSLAMLKYAQNHQGSFPNGTDPAEADQQVRKALAPY
jgi:type II secretory pathway pseudopilin PulG